jgi:hypothetical protein
MNSLNGDLRKKKRKRNTSSKGADELHGIAAAHELPAAAGPNVSSKPTQVNIALLMLPNDVLGFTCSSACTPG